MGKRQGLRSETERQQPDNTYGTERTIHGSVNSKGNGLWLGDKGHPG